MRGSHSGTLSLKVRRKIYPFRKTTNRIVENLAEFKRAKTA